MKITNKHVKGILYILIAAFCFSIMTLCVRLAGDLPTMQKVFFRNAVAAIIAVVTLARSAEKFHIKKTSWPSIIMRCVFGTSGMILNFWAIDRLGLADANMLNKMSPFFAIIMSIFILKEKPTLVEWITVVIAFIGAAFIVKPTAGIASIPALAGLGGGLGAGIAYAFVRKLGTQGERGPVIVMCFSVFSCLVAVPFLIIDGEPMTWQQTLLLAGSGIAAAGGQFGITAAYQHAPAKEISVFDYMQVVFATLWGVILFSELPDVYSIIGYVLIIGTAVFKWQYNIRRSADSEAS